MTLTYAVVINVEKNAIQISRSIQQISLLILNKKVTLFDFDHNYRDQARRKYDKGGS